MSKVGFLVDGGYFSTRIKETFKVNKSESDLCNILFTIIKKHIKCNEELYRVFYYDCAPYKGEGKLPISNTTTSFASTPTSVFRERFFNLLCSHEFIALRLGSLAFSGYTLKNSVPLDRVNIDYTISDSDYRPEFRQKGVDMKLGIDIATLSYKKLVDRIVIIAGDADFAPAAKLARVEGITVTLDALNGKTNNELLKHIDQHITYNLRTFGESRKKTQW